nr:hypothetical protein [Fusobacterium ulcerans]
MLIPFSPAIKSLPCIVVSPPALTLRPPTPPTVLPTDVDLVSSKLLDSTVNNPFLNPTKDDSPVS